MSHRQIVIDVETTGLSCRNGDRIIEIGCVEIKDRIPTGLKFHPTQGNLRAPAQFAFGERDIGLALFWIVLRQRLISELRCSKCRG